MNDSNQPHACVKENTTKIFHGLIREPDLSFPDEAEDMGEEEGDKPKVEYSLHFP